MESLRLALRMECFHAQYIAIHKRKYGETINPPRAHFAEGLYGFMRFIALNGGSLG